MSDTNDTPETPPPKLSFEGPILKSGRPMRITFNTSWDAITDAFGIITWANLRPESERFKPKEEEEVSRDD
jgi:hypothetical protein